MERLVNDNIIEEAGVDPELRGVRSASILRSKSGRSEYRGKHRSQTQGKGIMAFFRNNWMKRYHDGRY